VVDYPNSAKAKKHYLVLGFDRNNQAKQKGLATMSSANRQQVTVSGHSNNNNTRGKKQVPIRKKKGSKTKEWILHKKEVQRKKGKDVRPDSKYTGRKRPTKF